MVRGYSLSGVVWRCTGHKELSDGQDCTGESEDRSPCPPLSRWTPYHYATRAVGSPWKVSLNTELTFHSNSLFGAMDPIAAFLREPSQEEVSSRREIMLFLHRCFVDIYIKQLLEVAFLPRAIGSALLLLLSSLGVCL